VWSAEKSAKVDAMPEPLFDSPRLLAGIDMLRRTGLQTYRVGCSHEDEEPPVVWYAVGQWVGNRAEAAAALDPVTATMRLCEQVIDGGECTHCKRLTIFDDNPGDSPFDDLLSAMGCVYAWDPELSTFRRGCEGDHA
jgi:hypothetical protein